MLDRTEQRIVGVLIEKQKTVPDTYPLSEKALLAGCNQHNNREPVMELESFQLAGALMALQEKGWVARVDGGSRVTKYRHKVVERLGLTDAELCVFAELLLRGPQAPGALKPRVQRMGLHGEAEDVARVLEGLRTRPQPLVEPLPRAPRERDHRWRHLVGDQGAGAPTLAQIAAEEAEREPVPEPAPNPLRAQLSSAEDLERRVVVLEQQVAALRSELEALRGGASSV